MNQEKPVNSQASPWSHYPNGFPIFDGHNDCVLSLAMPERGHDRSFFEESEHGHIDLPRARRGGLAGGFFAIFIPNPEMVEEAESKDAEAIDEDFEAQRRNGTWPLPDPLDFEFAAREAERLASLMFDVERESKGAFRIVRTIKEIESCFDDDAIAAIFHFEGAEPIAPDLSNLADWYERGLRSLGLVWSRGNAFAEGVPFRCPGSPDTGPGLTDAGKVLVKSCNELGILIDLSHLNESGFWDVSKLSAAPLVATHCCAHAICPSARNLIDAQLDAIRDSNGIVGLNFFVGDVRADGELDADTPLDMYVRQFDYFVERMGIDHVALGSDFDGARMPTDVKDAAHLPNLVKALRKVGYNEKSLHKLAYANWLRILRDTWQTD